MIPCAYMHSVIPTSEEQLIHSWIRYMYMPTFHYHHFQSKDKLNRTSIYIEKVTLIRFGASRFTSRSMKRHVPELCG